MILKRAAYLALFLAIIFLFCYHLFNRKTGKGTDPRQRYRLARDWPKLPGDMVLGSPTGLGVSNKGYLVVFHRADRTWPLLGPMPGTTIKANTVLLIDSSGRMVNSWGGRRFIMPHGLYVDRQDNVWLTDAGLHQVFKFDLKGKLLMTLGQAGVPGKGSAHFNRPTDVAVAADGSVYVSDGYGNSRVVKFSAEGRYLLEWGAKGSRPGQFNIPHALSIDGTGNIYVADRENNRIQVFDQAGKFLKEFGGKDIGNLTSVKYDTARSQLIAADDVSFLRLKHIGSDLILFDAAGVLRSRFGRSGHYEGSACWYHDVETDQVGNIYAADILQNRIHKFVPR